VATEFIGSISISFLRRSVLNWTAEKNCRNCSSFAEVIIKVAHFFSDTQCRTGFPLTKKSRTFQDPMKNFPGPFWSPRRFKYKEKNGSYLQYSDCSTLQKIQHEAKCRR